MVEYWWREKFGHYKASSVGGVTDIRSLTLTIFLTLANLNNFPDDFGLNEKAGGYTHDMINWSFYHFLTKINVQ